MMSAISFIPTPAHHKSTAMTRQYTTMTKFDVINKTDWKRNVLEEAIRMVDMSPNVVVRGAKSDVAEIVMR
jgi:hypothetical protein